jgi:hypothetical protein
MWQRWVSVVLAVVVAVATTSQARPDAVDRLTAERLEAVHEAILKLKDQRKDVERPGSLRDFRANLHVHSAFSHDSRGTIAQIVTAAKAAGTKVLLFSEHPADHYDFFKDGHQGMRDGVLLIPGAEMKGMLVYPRESVRGLDTGSPQEFSDLVHRKEGLTFLSHLEERMDWELRGITGVEIYNTHANFKNEKRLAKSLRDPFWLFRSADLFRKYPQEAFSALQEYPADYLQRWDQLCQRFPHTGVAANDAHQNIGVTIKLAQGNKASVEDALGKKLVELDVAVVGAILPIPKEAKVGDVLFQIQLDPYENSLRHVGTHLLLTELTREAVWQALEKGRAFVAFDWIADATGFDFAARVGEARHEMGSRIKFAKDMQLTGRAPLAGNWKLFRNGKMVSESTGLTFEKRLTEPGNYRTELWLDVAGEQRVWVLSNPIYITGE